MLLAGLAGAIAILLLRGRILLLKKLRASQLGRQYFPVRKRAAITGASLE